MASAAPLSFPGTCTTSNLQRRVFCLKLRILGLSMSPSSLSPRIFSRGLWSTATVSLSLPRVKWRVFWRAQATARASPSTGAYLDSAPVVNLLPARTTFHPVLQQPGTLPSHWQCFWDRWNPIPVLLQSVPRRVVLPGSKDSMPSLMASRILALLALKAALCASPHRSPHFSPAPRGLRNGRSGSLMVWSLWKQSTWLVRPNQLRTPVMSFGSGNSAMLLSMSSLGSTEFLVSLNPRYSSSSRPKENFSSLKVMPAREQWVRY